MNQWMDPLGDHLTIRTNETGWEFAMEPYPSGQFGLIDDPEHQFGNSVVWTWTPTQRDGPEPLVTRSTDLKHMAVMFDITNRTSWKLKRRSWIKKNEEVKQYLPKTSEMIYMMAIASPKHGNVIGPRHLSLT
jgi:hypothetical protein